MRKRLTRGAIAGFSTAAIPGLFVTFAEYLGLGAWGYTMVLFAMLAVVVGGVALLAIVFASIRAGAARTFVFCVAFVLSTFVFVRVSAEARDLAFAALAERSDGLIAAINEFEAANGRPPGVLAELVPARLAQLPETGMPACPDYEYEVFEPDTAVKLHWFDLGSRAGEDIAGLWKYIDGDRGHAILVITTDDGGTVRTVDTDRLPAKLAPAPFDAQRWSAHSSGRMAMLEDLLASVQPVGRSITEIRNVLGAPDGTRTLRNAEWELRVPCPNGPLNWDVFFYWPSEDYPRHIYGGSVERIARWAYVNE